RSTTKRTITRLCQPGLQAILSLRDSCPTFLALIGGLICDVHFALISARSAWTARSRLRRFDCAHLQDGNIEVLSECTVSLTNCSSGLTFMRVSSEGSA